MKWIGRLIELTDGNHAYKVLTINVEVDDDGRIWYWARTAG